MAIFTKSFTLTGGESPSGTLVTTTSQQIAASQTTGVVSTSGPWDVWALTAGQQISRNGTVDPNSALVTKLYYNNHTLYQFDGTNWRYYNTARSTATTFSWTLVNDPTAAVVPNVWSASHKQTSMTLSSDGLTATLPANLGGDAAVYANEITASGAQASLVYWELVLNSPNTSGEVGFGTNTASVSTGTFMGFDTFSVGWRGDAGWITFNNTHVATWATFAVGARVCFALDLVNGKAWGRVGSGNWNNDVIANQDPATNTGGYSIPTSIFVNGSNSVYIVPGASLSNGTNTVVASFEPASWLFTPPVGYMPWSATKPAISIAESVEALVVKTTNQTIVASRTNLTPSNGPFNYFQLNSSGGIQFSTDGINYTAQVGPSGVTALLYHKDSLFQLNNAGNWWYWNTTTSDATAGIPGYTFYNLAGPVALSNTSYTANAAIGTYTATISCPMSSSAANDSFPGNWGGSFTLDSTSAATFSINGSTITNKVALTAASYAPVITAALNITGSDSVVYSVGHAITTTVSLTSGAAGSLIQVPVGVWLGPFLGGGAQWATSINAHWTAFNTDMGRTATHLGAVMTNAAQYGGNPSTWGSGESGQFAANSIPNTVSPLTTFVFTNGTSNVDFTDYANGTFDTQIQSNLNGWKNAGFKKMYIRVNWEFNDGGPNSNFVFPSQASIATWVSAYKHFANVCHTWGNNNGVTMRIIWSPTTNNGHTVDINGTSTTGIPVSTLFPIPDGNGTGTGGRYIDVLGCDLYAFGFSVNDPTVGSGDTNLATNTGWFLKSYVEMCQQYNCNLGFSEAGIVAPYSSGALTTWCNTVGNYLNTLSSLSPAVPIEYWTIYDVHTTIGGTGLYTPSMTNTAEVTFSDYLGNFKALFGGPQNSRSVMTIPPI